MAKRRYGPLEERLRAAVDALVGGSRGRNQEVAAKIDRPPSWLTVYRGGRTHANLDTSLALMRVLGWALTEDLRDATAPAVDPDLLLKLTDSKNAEQVRAFLELPAPMRAALILMPTHLATADSGHTPIRSAGPTRVRPQEIARTKSAGGRRR